MFMSVGYWGPVICNILARITLSSSIMTRNRKYKTKSLVASAGSVNRERQGCIIFRLAMDNMNEMI